MLFAKSSAETTVLGCWFQKSACVTLEKSFEAAVFSSVSGDSNASLAVRIKLLHTKHSLHLACRVPRLCLLLLLQFLTHSSSRNDYIKEPEQGLLCG